MAWSPVSWSGEVQERIAGSLSPEMKAIIDINDMWTSGRRRGTQMCEKREKTIKQEKQVIV